MSLFKWWIGIVVVAVFFGAPIQLIADDATSIIEEFSLDDSKQTTSAPLIASSHPDELHFEHRMAQERNKLYLCVMIGLVMIIGLTVSLYFLTRTAYSPEQIVNTSGLAFIIFGTLYVVILADVEAQLTASTGILGAVAGYLFRAMNRVGGEPKGENAAKDEPAPK